VSTSHDPTSKPIPFYLSLTAGAGLILMMLALGIGVVQGSAADSTVVGVTFAAGIGLLVIGIIGWFAVVQPSRHFDDINEVLPLFKDDTLIARPGSGYNYSSYGYNLIGAAIQAASGTKYQDFVVREIIAPLGLKATGYDDVRKILPHRAHRYSYYDPWTFAIDSVTLYRVPEWDYSHNPAGGNMYSTAADLARFGRAIEKPGLLSPESHALLMKRPKVGSAESPMSFGFFVSPDTAAHRRLNIGGSNAGLQSGLAIYPDDDLVIVIISNTWGIGSSSGEMTGALMSRLAAICMGWKPVP